MTFAHIGGMPVEEFAPMAAPAAMVFAYMTAGFLSWLLRIDCGADGGMAVDRDFFLDLHDRPGGPARAHEVRLQGGDCTTEIFP